jgi:hypothetical protein
MNFIKLLIKPVIVIIMYAIFWIGINEGLKRNDEMERIRLSQFQVEAERAITKP